MKHNTLVRLLVKLLGVYFLANGVIQIVQVSTWLVAQTLRRSMPAGLDWSAYAVQVLTHAVSLALGCYLFFGGKWVVDKIIPSNRPYCPECCYELTGLVGERCPECGVELPPSLLGREPLSQR